MVRVRAGGRVGILIFLINGSELNRSRSRSETYLKRLSKCKLFTPIVLFKSNFIFAIVISQVIEVPFI